MASTRRWALPVLIVACLASDPAPCRAAADANAAQAERLVASIVQKGKGEPSDFSAMSGGWAESPLKDTGESLASRYTTWLLGRWRSHAAELEGKDPDLKALRALGSEAAAAINEALPTLKPEDQVSSHLAWVLGHVGDRRSVEVLIDLLRRAGRGGNPFHHSFARRATVMGATSALWELTGRPFQQNSTGWYRWWWAVREDFVPARRRGKRKVAAAELEARVRDLAAGKPSARERLIVLGPNAVEHLLGALQAASGRLQYDLAWVLDEMGAARRMPPDVRRGYFIERLGKENFSVTLGVRARLRALSEQSFADFCRTAIELDARPPREGLGMSGWIKVTLRSFREAVPGYEKQIPAAVGVIVRGLGHAQRDSRLAAVRIANRIGIERARRRGTTRPAGGATAWDPAKLISALRRHWLGEKDDFVRYETGVALVRYRSGEVTRAIREGLWSSREEILGDAAAFADDIWRAPGPEKRRVCERLTALTRHQSDRVRGASVRSLYYMEPKLLAGHLDRLCGDKVWSIRRRCAMAIGELKDPAFVPLLLQLSQDPEERVVSQALDELADPAFRSAVPPLAKRLADADCANRGKVQWAIAGAGGPLARGALIREVRLGCFPHDGNVVGALAKVVGKRFRQRDECTRWAWRAHPDLPDLSTQRRPGELDEKAVKRLWGALAESGDQAAYPAIQALLAKPDRAVALIGKMLQPVRPQQDQVRRCIRQLGDRKYATRAAAFVELSRAGPEAEDALRQAVKGKLSAEARGRIERLLAACDETGDPLPEVLRASRAIRILEIAASKPAREMLARLSRGAARAPATEMAKAALAGLARRDRQRKQQPWGKEADGLQCRLRPPQSTWQPGRSPLLWLDVRNTGTVEYEIVPSETFCEVQIDSGEVYRHRLRSGERSSLGPGQVLADIPICLDGNFLAAGSGRPIRLAPGSQKVRIRIVGVVSEVEVRVNRRGRE